MNAHGMFVSIDGPGGAGKSTAAALAASSSPPAASGPRDSRAIADPARAR